MEYLVMMTKMQFKRKVKEAVKNLNRRELIDEMGKLDFFKFENEEFEMKKYFSDDSIDDARTEFATDTQMLRSVMTFYSSDPMFAADLWSCEAGCGGADYLRRIQICPGYSMYWENRSRDNTLDTIHYLQDVVDLRMGLSKHMNIK